MIDIAWLPLRVGCHSREDRNPAERIVFNAARLLEYNDPDVSA
jgi:hypothetical protein